MDYGKLDAVLPLIFRDYDRFKILDRSLEKFFDDLGTLYIVTSSLDFKKLQACIKNPRYKVIDELSLIPEFKYFKSVSGWAKQQLVKLAITDYIKSDFFLTLDSDVILTKALRISDIIIDGRAPCYRDKEGLHNKWYDNVERVLGFAPHYRRHNVTPAILSKLGVQKLNDHMQKMAFQTPLSFFKKRDLILFAAKLTSKTTLLSNKLNIWRTYALTSLPWTEYSLYYSFLENTNQFDDFHFEVDINRCLFSHKNSIWENDLSQFKQWDPRSAFDLSDGAFFVVMQSNTGITAEQIWEKVKPFLS